VRVAGGPLLVGVLAAVALGGCGSRAADLFEVTRTGSIEGANLRLVVTDDGRAVCNGGPDRDITSDQLIDARTALRELQGKDDKVGPADRRLSLPPGPRSILRYRVRVEGGSVAFSDTSRGQPPVFFRLAQLVRGIARGPCGLAR
jgi:hypothetical protein